MIYDEQKLRNLIQATYVFRPAESNGVQNNINACVALDNYLKTGEPGPLTGDELDAKSMNGWNLLSDGWPPDGRMPLVIAWDESPDDVYDCMMCDGLYVAPFLVIAFSPTTYTDDEQVTMSWPGRFEAPTYGGMEVPVLPKYWRLVSPQTQSNRVGGLDAVDEVRK